MQDETLIDDLIRCCALTRIIHGDDSYEYAENCVRLAHAYLQCKGMLKKLSEIVAYKLRFKLHTFFINW